MLTFMLFDLASLIAAVGYLGVFTIVFLESGLLIGFFFPGDSLLFTAGFLASQGYLDIKILITGCFIAAVAGDFTIFRFIKDNLTRELELIYDHIDGDHHFKKVLHTKYFSWTLPVIGAIIIASPFPDEIGVSLMSISKMKTYQFILISFLLNAIGIFLVVSASLVIKP